MENWYKGNIIYNYNWVYKKTKNKFLFFNFVKKYISNIKTSIDTTGFEKWYKNSVIEYLYKITGIPAIVYCDTKRIIKKQIIVYIDTLRQILKRLRQFIKKNDFIKKRDDFIKKNDFKKRR